MSTTIYAAQVSKPQSHFADLTIGIVGGVSTGYTITLAGLLGVLMIQSGAWVVGALTLLGAAITAWFSFVGISLS